MNWLQFQFGLFNKIIEQTIFYSNVIQSKV